MPAPPRDPAAEATPVPLARAVGRALLLRCPDCGARGILASWLKLRERCPVCGIVLERGESDFFIGAYMINLVVAEMAVAGLLVTVLLATWPDPPWTLLTYGGGALMIVAAAVCYPFAKTLWLAVDLRFRPSRAGATTPGAWADDA
ncbi:MAG TPA: DUF983 domain-containing protein [Gemmatimonadaceae bacterium]|nr:DUF983 domain-containing protein [Gemmatimonadaceae bacterium]